MVTVFRTQEPLQELFKICEALKEQISQLVKVWNQTQSMNNDVTQILYQIKAQVKDNIFSTHFFKRIQNLLTNQQMVTQLKSQFQFLNTPSKLLINLDIFLKKNPLIFVQNVSQQSLRSEVIGFGSNSQIIQEQFQVFQQAKEYNLNVEALHPFSRYIFTFCYHNQILKIAQEYGQMLQIFEQEDNKSVDQIKLQVQILCAFYRTIIDFMKLESKQHAELSQIQKEEITSEYLLQSEEYRKFILALHYNLIRILTLLAAFYFKRHLTLLLDQVKTYFKLNYKALYDTQNEIQCLRQIYRMVKDLRTLFQDNDIDKKNYEELKKYMKNLISLYEFYNTIFKQICIVFQETFVLTLLKTFYTFFFQSDYKSYYDMQQFSESTSIHKLIDNHSCQISIDFLSSFHLFSLFQFLANSKKKFFDATPKYNMYCEILLNIKKFIDFSQTINIISLYNQENKLIFLIPINKNCAKINYKSLIIKNEILQLSSQNGTTLNENVYLRPKQLITAQLFQDVASFNCELLRERDINLTFKLLLPFGRIDIALYYKEQLQKMQIKQYKPTHLIKFVIKSSNVIEYIHISMKCYQYDFDDGYEVEKAAFFEKNLIVSGVYDSIVNVSDIFFNFQQGEIYKIYCVFDYKLILQNQVVSYVYTEKTEKKDGEYKQVTKGQYYKYEIQNFGCNVISINSKDQSFQLEEQECGVDAKQIAQDLHHFLYIDLSHVDDIEQLMHQFEVNYFIYCNFPQMQNFFITQQELVQAYTLRESTSQNILLICYLTGTKIKSILKFVENNQSDFLKQIV
eukprot:TRINITY_DN385_c0_g2_i1.p1 TRINITY_DN385_c0_g2~~TRINITY_DN385_c0_g2_i1.p1  ORF type:complete len:794 (+),score=94.24 TRINITY_DN385_c0_g2_i1:301-2682(+)